MTVETSNPIIVTNTGLISTPTQTEVPYGLVSSSIESTSGGTVIDPLRPLTTNANFSNQPLTGYTSDSPNSLSQVSDAGSTLQLSGQAWKKLDFIYNVTANTVLEFEFRSNKVGNLSAIGFDNDNNYWNTDWSKPTGFKLAGNDEWSGWNQSLNNYSGTDWRNYSINIGKDYTGSIKYLFFANNIAFTTSPTVDTDSLFRNVKLYDINSLDTIAPTVTTVNAPTITASSLDYSFKVNYTDSVLMNPASLDGKDIRVTGANGFNQLAQFMSAVSSSDRKTVEATYKITSNVGWGINDKNGVYTIALEGNQVSDGNYNWMAAGTLGTFNINVPINVPAIDPNSNIVSNLSPALAINSNNLSSYIMGGTGSVQVSDNGSTLQLSGEVSRKLDFAYNVTPYTVLEFQFRSDKIGNSHVIGFDNDNNYWNTDWSKPTGFKLAGSATWSGWNQVANNYSGTEWKTYSVKIGDYYKGNIQYLFFTNLLTLFGDSNAIADKSPNSFFHNIRMYDINSSDISAPTTNTSISNGTVAALSASVGLPNSTPASSINYVNANTEYQFTVTYSDSSGINLASLDGNDIKVQAPNGTLQNAILVSTLPSSDRKTVAATYKIFDNLGWSNNQNSEYLILLQGNQVSDQNYNFSAAKELGRFTVVYSSVSSTTQELRNSQSEFQFNVSYFSSTGIDLTSLDNGDLRVTGPNNFQKAANFVSVQKNGTSEWIATYKIIDNDGMWDAKNNGNYVINLQANQVRSISGYSLAATTLGNLVINTQETALWYSGFENGFPGGEWSSYDTGYYTANGQPTTNANGSLKDANWTIINQTQANQEGVMALSGNSVYKGWINNSSTDSHRAYPLISIDPSNQYYPDTTFDDYLSKPSAPIVNRFYAWMDWDPSKIGENDWLSFMTASNNTNWGVVGFSLRGANGQLEMAHAPWQSVTATPTYMQQDRWVRFTTYMDFKSNLLYVWMDGTLVFKMTQGGNLNYTDGGLNGQTDHLRRAHWGLYANGNFSNATVYNDSIQLWTMQTPLTDPSLEPWSPYDGNGVSFAYSSDKLAPTIASLYAPTITTSSTEYLFKVTYSDDVILYSSSLDSKDIRVTGANGFNQLAKFVSATTSNNGKTVEATYKIISNVGWGINDKNGVYTISLQGNQVSDYNYNWMTGRNLGTLTINVPMAAPSIIDPESNIVGNSLPILTINSNNLSNYTSGGNGPVQVSDDGSTLQLSGQAWKKIDFLYNVTPYTVLEFQFRSDKIGNTHVIGFDNDNNYWNTDWSKPTGFKVAGSETWPGWNLALNNYSGTDWKTYSVKIGDYYAGNIQYLFFANLLTFVGDPNTIADKSPNSFFRNIRVYDINSSDISAPTLSTTNGINLANATVTNGKTTVTANTEYQFTVTYKDLFGLSLATLDGNDIKVEAPNGTMLNATLVSTTASSDRKTVSVTYKIYDNVGLRSSQNSEYLILLQGNQVSDLNYNFMAAEELGRFTVV